MTLDKEAGRQVNEESRRYILTITCPDRAGVVAAVTGFIAGHGGWVIEAAQHGDLSSGRFFQRIEILADSLEIEAEEFKQGFSRVAEELSAEWHLSDSHVPKRVVVLASREDHCLAELLHRWKGGDLKCEIEAVISNHSELEELVAWYGVDFYQLAHDPVTQRPVQREVADIFDRLEGEVMVLARYMQILPPAICERYPGQIINIHHSFLPSFAGARPYHQAYERGVKLIGATCHYVTAELDGGAIIEQDIRRIDHGDSVDELRRIGREIERSVLLRGLRWHLEDRVLLNGNRTVVFD